MVKERTEKQEAILDATLELIGERGFHGTPISAVANKAGVGAGTIYRYYCSKEELINDLYLREKREASKRLLIGYRPEMHTRDAIGLIWRNLVAAQSENPSRSRFLDQYSNSPFIADEVDEDVPRLGYGDASRRIVS